MTDPTPRTGRIRRPPEPQEIEQLRKLLDAVPAETVTRYSWSTPEGQAFVEQLRAIQLSGVALPWLAEEMGEITRYTLDGAISYYKRGSAKGLAARRRRASGKHRRE